MEKEHGFCMRGGDVKVVYEDRFVPDGKTHCVECGREMDGADELVEIKKITRVRSGEEIPPDSNIGRIVVSYLKESLNGNIICPVCAAHYL